MKDEGPEQSPSGREANSKLIRGKATSQMLALRQLQISSSKRLLSVLPASIPHQADDTHHLSKD